MESEAVDKEKLLRVSIFTPVRCYRKCLATITSVLLHGTVVSITFLKTWGPEQPQQKQLLAAPEKRKLLGSLLDLLNQKLHCNKIPGD